MVELKKHDDFPESSGILSFWNLCFSFFQRKDCKVSQASLCKGSASFHWASFSLFLTKPGHFD